MKRSVLFSAVAVALLLSGCGDEPTSVKEETLVSTSTTVEAEVVTVPKAEVVKVIASPVVESAVKEVVAPAFVQEKVVDDVLEEGEKQSILESALDIAKSAS